MADFVASGTTIGRVSALCLYGYTQNQLLRDIDAASMSQSLEVRVPFLDVPLANLALSLPDSTKLAEPILHGQRISGTYQETGAKRILIDAGADLLPPDMNRQEKRGFGMPFDVWLRGDLRDVLHNALSRSRVVNRGLFHPAEVERRLNAFFSGRSSWVFPWLLLVIELWCQEVLEPQS
jgi:asparagine synthase (glutamine-hydrolysing)